MKERGKALNLYITENDPNFQNTDEFSYTTTTYDYSHHHMMPCRKHPPSSSSSSSSGICAHCLKDKLVNLVCSECGEQRLSSCSCSDVSPYRNSSSFVEIEKPKNGEKNPQEFVLFKRSSSSCVEIKRGKNGFWKIKRLFRRKKEKGIEKFDEKSDLFDVRGVSRSRSLCSFRGFNNGDEQGSDYGFSSAKISDVTGGVIFDAFEHRKSGLFKGLSDAESEPRKSGLFRGLSDAENEPRKSGLFRGLSDAESEPRKSGLFRGLNDFDQNDYQPRKSGLFKGLSDAETEPRKSGLFRGLFDNENEPRRKSGFKGLKIDCDNQNETRESGGNKCLNGKELNRVNSVPTNRSVFPAKESDFFSAMDESAFIDLKLDFSSESRREFSLDDDGGRLRSELHEYDAKLNEKDDVMMMKNHIDINVNGSKSSHKIWKWIFRQKR